MLGTDRCGSCSRILGLGYSINSEDPAEIEAARDLTLHEGPAVRPTRLRRGWTTGARDGARVTARCNYATNKNVEFVVLREATSSPT